MVGWEIPKRNGLVCLGKWSESMIIISISLSIWFIIYWYMIIIYLWIYENWFFIAKLPDVKPGKMWLCSAKQMCLNLPILVIFIELWRHHTKLVRPKLIQKWQWHKTDTINPHVICMFPIHTLLHIYIYIVYCFVYFTILPRVYVCIV